MAQAKQGTLSKVVDSVKKGVKAVKEFGQKTSNQMMGLGRVTDAERPAALAALAQKDPIKAAFVGSSIDMVDHSTFGIGGGVFSLGNVAAEIAAGHAFEKHVIEQGEFADLGITTRGQFADHIENVMTNPTATKDLSGGRSAFWGGETGTVVIRNPNAVDGGTAFRPVNGQGYFDGLR